MFNIEDILTTAMTLAGRGDKPSSDDMAVALRTFQLILADWATTRDVTFWNVAETSTILSQGDVVKVGGNYYQCYVNHVALAINEPEVGAVWENFWVPCAATTSPLTWAADNSYLNQKTLVLTDLTLEDILTPKIQYQGQFSFLEKISAMEFMQLPMADTGTPTKCWAQKTPTGLTLHLHPLPDNTETNLFYYSITRPNPIAADGITDMADQWVPAMYYNLAVELGFIYNIGMERLNILGQKAKFELEKAMRTNNSEVDTCFVKPLY